MAKATNVNVEPFTRMLSSKVESLDDLIKFGYLSNDKYQKYFAKRRPSYIEIETVQPAEKDNYSSDPWNYKINKYNFRGNFDIDNKHPKIGFFGCSFTFGEGVREEHTHPYIVGKDLALNAFNFGLGGSGIERVAKTFSAVNSVMDLDYAVITLPTWFRHLHLDGQGYMMNIVLGMPNKSHKNISRFLAQASDEYYMTRASSLINWMYDLARYKKVKLIFSSWDHAVNKFCQLAFPDNTIDPFPSKDNGRARDNLHPGPKSQQEHAEQIIKAFNDRAWI